MMKSGLWYGCRSGANIVTATLLESRQQHGRADGDWNEPRELRQSKDAERAPLNLPS